MNHKTWMRWYYAGVSLIIICSMVFCATTIYRVRDDSQKAAVEAERQYVSAKLSGLMLQFADAGRRGEERDALGDQDMAMVFEACAGTKELFEIANTVATARFQFLNEEAMKSCVSFGRSLQVGKLTYALLRANSDILTDAYFDDLNREQRAEQEQKTAYASQNVAGMAAWR